MTQLRSILERRNRKDLTPEDDALYQKKINEHNQRKCAEGSYLYREFQENKLTVMEKQQILTSLIDDYRYSRIGR